MPDTKFNCLPTIIGSMPHTDPEKACALINHYLMNIPAWPQLPKRSFRESMSVQFSQGFPGIVEKDNCIYVDRSEDLDEPLEELYTAYLDNDIDKYPVGADYAAGLHTFLDQTYPKPKAVKGQITGPISWGLSVTDDGKRAILYDDMLSDATAKLLRLKAGWQEKELSKISKNTIIFIDEPSMASYGSAFFSLPRERVVSLLEEVLGGINNIKGIHCCGNTDWPIILDTSTDILSFDTYNYAESLTLYPSEVKQFLDRGGAIAWGIVPNAEDRLSAETVSSLKDRLEEAMAPFARNGISFRQLVEQGLLTPSCSLSLLTKDGADHTLELLVGLSQEIRKRYR
ncbi:MAG: methionine synthase [Dehalococcoidia bacterium]|nr:MAG: methionine synthase [Dehalococcoidia bacterium]